MYSNYLTPLHFKRSKNCLRYAVDEEDVELESVVSPRAEFESARLGVERKVLDVDLAGGLEDGWWHPEHFAG